MSYNPLPNTLTLTVPHYLSKVGTLKFKDYDKFKNTKSKFLIISTNNSTILFHNIYIFIGFANSCQ